MRGLVLLALLACAADARGAARAETIATPAAGPAAPVACGPQAARYDSGTGFALVATRAGEVRVEDPLRPLTPAVNRVLQVVIAGKLATVFGPDLATLRRGGPPGAVEAMLGAPIRWEASLPALPDPLAIVAEDGAPLAELSFRGCEDPPLVRATPRAAKRAPAGAKVKDAARKAPPGFAMPQGAIAE